MNTGRTHLILLLVTVAVIGVSVASWTRASASRLAESQGKLP